MWYFFSFVQKRLTARATIIKMFPSHYPLRHKHRALASCSFGLLSKSAHNVPKWAAQRRESNSRDYHLCTTRHPISRRLIILLLACPLDLTLCLQSNIFTKQSPKEFQPQTRLRQTDDRSWVNQFEQKYIHTTHSGSWMEENPKKEDAVKGFTLRLSSRCIIQTAQTVSRRQRRVFASAG